MDAPVLKAPKVNLEDLEYLAYLVRKVIPVYLDFQARRAIEEETDVPALTVMNSTLF